MHFKQRCGMVGEEIDLLYQQLVEVMPELSRIAVALHEPENGTMHAFLKTSTSTDLLNHYSFPLADSPSLLALAQSGQSRIVDDLSLLPNQSFHTKMILEAGYQSSFTQPIYLGDELLGFVFFDSNKKYFFTEKIINQLTIYVRLIEAILVMDILPVRTLMGMINSARHVTALKDEETGKHITRVASYVEIIASELSKTRAISDEEIEYMWLYAPLHDIGKMAVPDEVLLKTESFNPDDYAAIQLHVTQGVKIIQEMLQDFGFSNLHHTDILLDIINYHHERWDGSGYPHKLKGDKIPLAGRIMAVADVLDALSSKRIYRDAFGLDYSLQYIAKERGQHFDPDCVDALFAAEDKIRQAFSDFKEHGF